MGQVTVKIPLVTWRDGRPRFIPGVRLRKLKLVGEDLRHPDGGWFTLDQAIAWSRDRAALIKTLDAARPRDRGALARRAGAGITVGQLFELWFLTPRLNGEKVVEGKRERAGLMPNTARSYRNAARQLERLDDGLVWFASAEALTGKRCDGIIRAIEVKHGLATARAVRAAMQGAFKWGRREGKVSTDPLKASDEQLPMPAPRIRYGSIAEMKTLVAAADAIGLPEIGDAVMLGLWTGQRQGDRLALGDGQVTPGGILFRQSKKHGQPLLIPEAPELARRLRAARERRRDWRVNYPHVVLDEVTRGPFAGEWYRKKFRRVREAAVRGVPGLGVDWIVAPCPSLADFHDQDLRDTAVTWLALAGVDKIRIASVTGHSLKSVDEILKHYLGMHPELARSAIASLVDWYDEEVKK